MLRQAHGDVNGRTVYAQPVRPTPRTRGSGRLLQAVAWGEAPVRFAGSDVGGGGAVAAEHLAGPPASQPHQVGLTPTLGEPGVGERVAELVGMQSWQAGLVASAAQELLYPQAVSRPRFPSHSQGR